MQHTLCQGHGEEAPTTHSAEEDFWCGQKVATYSAEDNEEEDDVLLSMKRTTRKRKLCQFQSVKPWRSICFTYVVAAKIEKEWYELELPTLQEYQKTVDKQLFSGSHKVSDGFLSL